MEKQKSITFAVIAVEALAILVLGALLFQSGGSLVGMSADKAGKLAVEYINENFGNGESPASFISASSENGVYKVVLDYSGTEYTSYVTKNGKLFFTEGYDMQPAKAKEFAKTDKPELDLFTMAFCPYGNDAESIIAPIMNLLKDKIDVGLHYIFYGKYGPEDQASQYCYDEERAYCSMHGIQELNQGVREMCVAKYEPSKLWDFVADINENTDSTNVDSKWEGIATKLGIDTSKIKDCYKNEAESFLKSEVELTDKDYPVQDPAQYKGEEEAKIAGSPTFVINGMIYSGARTPEDIKKAVCSAFKTAPEECSQELNASSTAAEGSC
ncbi:MAG: hypothetical protein PHV47_00950 [Candidatus Pacebacteria bacterium]|nr:hypothetical protein [Candidatus Paceibacterota bacterium]